MKRVFFAAGAIALVVGLAACGGGGPAGGAGEVKVVGEDYKFTPAEVRVKAGQPVTIVLENKGRVEHDWAIEALKVAMNPIPRPGQTGRASFTPSQAGTFEIICTVAGHKELGMVGKLIVE